MVWINKFFFSLLDYNINNSMEMFIMGKIKSMLEEDIVMNPEIHDGSNEYEFWIYCERNKLTKKTRRSYVRKRKKSS